MANAKSASDLNKHIELLYRRTDTTDVERVYRHITDVMSEHIPDDYDDLADDVSRALKLAFKAGYLAAKKETDD
jgi:hypothetical protein